MSIAGFPTSSDIYLEVDGARVAVVQSYAVKTTKTTRMADRSRHAASAAPPVVVRVVTPRITLTTPPRLSTGVTPPRMRTRRTPPAAWWSSPSPWPTG